MGGHVANSMISVKEVVIAFWFNVSFGLRAAYPALTLSAIFFFYYLASFAFRRFRMAAISRVASPAKSPSVDELQEALELLSRLVPTDVLGSSTWKGPGLPLAAHEDEISAGLALCTAAKPGLLVHAATGSGKSKVLPKLAWSLAISAFVRFSWNCVF